VTDTDTTADTISAVKKPKPGTFSATYQPKHRRTADKIPHNVKADVVAGLAKHGEDGKGKNGFRGYVTYLALKHPKQAAKLIERLLPPSVVVASNPSSQVRSVNIVTVPSGVFLSAEEIRKAQSGSLLLEHEPQSEQIEQLEQLAELCEEPAAPEIVDEPPLEPAEEPDPVLQRAMALGYTPLPARPCKAE
jgi:hypothetical protein